MDFHDIISARKGRDKTHMSSTIQLAVSIVLAIVNSGLLHRFSKCHPCSAGDTFFFNGCVSLVWILVTVLVGGGFVIPTYATIFWGVAYGLATAGFLLFKMLALSCGNMSMTVMIGSSSLILPTLLGSWMYHESVSIVQAIGLVLLLAAMMLCCGGKTGGSLKWRCYCLLFWFFSGATGLIYKIHQNSAGRNEVSELMLVASVISAIAFFGIARFIHVKNGNMDSLGMLRETFPYILLCGACSCAYNWLNIRLSGALPSVIFFPTFNGSVILGSALMSRFFFRERLERMQVLGLLLGVFALMTVSNILSTVL